MSQPAVPTTQTQPEPAPDKNSRPHRLLHRARA
jgi:hypothetical protein